MNDSGKRQQFASGACRDTADNKPDPTLISPYFLERLANWLTLGAKKYSRHNWAYGIPQARILASLFRHLLAEMQGDTDEDHGAAMACNIMFYVHNQEMIRRGGMSKAMDDRTPWLKLAKGKPEPEAPSDPTQGQGVPQSGRAIWKDRNMTRDLEIYG